MPTNTFYLRPRYFSIVHFTHIKITAQKKRPLKFGQSLFFLVLFLAIQSIWCWCITYTVTRIDRFTGKLLQIKFIARFFLSLQLLHGHCALGSLVRFFVAMLFFTLSSERFVHAMFVCMLISNATGFWNIQCMKREMANKSKSCPTNWELDTEKKTNCESHKNTTIELKFIPKRI